MTSKHRMSRLARGMPWAVAVLTLGAAGLAHAANPYEGEGAVIYGAAPARGDWAAAPSASTAPQAAAQAGTDSTAPSVSAADAAPPAAAPLTRAEVRESARRWKQAGIATPSGDVGDTREVLAAREQFYALQTDVREIQYRAAAEREQEARYAAQQALLDELLAEADDASQAAPAVALQDEAQQPPGSPREVLIRPDMTVADLLRYLDDGADAGEVTVLMVSTQDDVD